MANQADNKDPKPLTQADLDATQKAHADALAELEDTRREAEQLRKDKAESDAALAKANALLVKAGGPVAIRGEYRGHAFTDGHRRVRNRQGVMGDTQKIIDSANAGDAEACALLDWLIEIDYSYFPAVQTASV